MKKLISITVATVMLALFASFAKADVQYFDAPDNYREKSEQGHYYLSSNKEMVFICEGYFTASPTHASSVRCPFLAYKNWMKMFHKGTKFWSRILQLSLLK